MPIFYTDNPLNVTASVIAVTATVANPVTIAGAWSGTSVPVTSSVSFPVWITGTITSAGGGAVTQGGAWTTQVSGVVGVTQSGAFSVQVSGSPTSLVWVTSTVGGPVYVQVTGALPVSQSNVPAGTVTVTASSASPLYVAFTGNLPTGTFPVVSVTTGTFPTVVVTSAVGSPVYIQVTGSVPVNTGTFPTITVSAHAVTQGGAWASQVSGVVGITQSGALSVFTSGTMGVTQSGAFSIFTSGTMGTTQSGAFTVQVSGALGSGSQAANPNPVLIGAADASNTVRTLLVNSGGQLYITASSAAPVWVTGTITSTGGGAVTQGGAWTTQVSGVIGVTQSGALTTQVSGVVGITQSGALAAQVSGSVTASLDKAGTANLVAVIVGNTTTVLLTASNIRKGATVFNTQATVYLGLGFTPTTALYHAKVPSASYYEVPYNFTGAINAIAAASGQTVNVGEFY